MSIDVITFMYEKLPFPVIMETAEGPWFNPKDVCDYLEIKGTKQTLNRLDQDEKRYSVKHKTTLISFGGIISVARLSRKPKTKLLQDIICRDIMPNLMKAYCDIKGTTVEKELSEVFGRIRVV